VGGKGHLFCEGVDWIHLAQDRVKCKAVVNVVMDLWGPLEAGNCLTSWATIRFSRITLHHEVSYIYMYTCKCIWLSI
jgi:hypothetical protein